MMRFLIELVALNFITGEIDTASGLVFIWGLEQRKSRVLRCKVAEKVATVLRKMRCRMTTGVNWGRKAYQEK